MMLRLLRPRLSEARAQHGIPYWIILQNLERGAYEQPYRS
jgi:hypothetical protein